MRTMGRIGLSMTGVRAAHGPNFCPEFLQGILEMIRVILIVLGAAESATKALGNLFGGSND